MRADELKILLDSKIVTKRMHNQRGALRVAHDSHHVRMQAHTNGKPNRGLLLELRKRPSRAGLRVQLELAGLRVRVAMAASMGEGVLTESIDRGRESRGRRKVSAEVDLPLMLTMSLP